MIIQSIPYPASTALVGGHRYWRLRLLWQNSSTVNVQEIEMRTAVGGADVTGSGTAFRTSGSGGNPASNAFDNSNATSTDIFSGGTIGYDFGVGNAPAIVEVAITCSSANYLGEFDVEYSDDNSAWSYAFSGSKRSGWTTSVAQVFSMPSAVASRYWRLRANTIQSGTTMACVECEMRETVGGADATGSGTASSSTFYPFGTFDASQAFDNNTGTLWSGDNGGAAAGEWLGYDFGSGVTKTIAQISWRARNDGNHGQSPTSGVIQSSPDGKSWLNRITFSGLSWSSGETKLIS